MAFFGDLNKPRKALTALILILNFESLINVKNCLDARFLLNDSVPTLEPIKLDRKVMESMRESLEFLLAVV
jgi:hypothetical protein